MNPPRRLLVVLGMHRSGTSALARGTQALGAELGHRLMPPSEGENPKGFWEDIDIYQLDREMLEAIGGDWHQLAAVQEAELAILECGEFPARATSILDDRTRDNTLFAFKDPRVARLLPFWKRRFEEGAYDVRYLVALRSPRAVARSLALRNGFDLRKGMLLWLDTMVAVLRGVRCERFVVVDYDRLLPDPIGQLRRAAEALDLPFDEDRARGYAEGFLDPDLRHHLPSIDESFHDLCPSLLHEVNARLQALAERVDHSSPAATEDEIGRWSRALRDGQSALWLVDRTERESGSLRELLLSRDAEIAVRDSAIAAKDAAIAGRDADIEARDVAIAAREAAIAERDDRIAESRRNVEEALLMLARSEQRNEALASEMRQLHEQLALLARERDGLERERDGLAAGLQDEQAKVALLSAEREELHLLRDTLNERLGASQECVHRLEGQLVLSRERVQALENALADERKTSSDLRASTSWRITGPLRALRRFVDRAIALPRRVFQDPWMPFRRAYHALPLTYGVRVVVKEAAYRIAPALFRSLPSYRIWSAQRLAVARLSAQPSDRVPRLWDGPLPGRIVLPFSIAPRVSVVIPVSGRRDLTLRCLASIARNPPRLPIEVIVVDDASPDDTPEHLANVEGIRVVRNVTNEGFVRACNRGAASALGEFLCFLNNDTEVAPRWIEELLLGFELFPAAGLVGSALVYPDGRLQEAGCILWQDGSVWNLGRGCDPSDPRFSYARVVDYCSGASLMVRRADFLDAGGFDLHFAPAYAEDADLALRFRLRGRQCICQPLSVVIHHEAASSATRADGGPKSLQSAHLARLHARWQSELMSHPAPGADDPADLPGASVRGRVLVLDSGTPTPDRDAGSVAAFNLMLMLRQAGFQVTFVPTDEMAFLGEYTPALQREGIEVLHRPFTRTLQEHLQSQGHRYDLVIAVRPHVAERYLTSIRRYCKKARLLYLAPDVHFLRLAREAVLAGRDAVREASDRMRERELSIVAAVDGVIVHSDVERDLLRGLVPAVPINVLPWAISISEGPVMPPGGCNIVFVGSYAHEPNVDAVMHFVHDILPRIRVHVPGARFMAAGSHPTDEMLALASEHVEITGHVHDLAAFLAKARVSVAPLRAGAGVKGKVVTALGAGVPVVATSLAIEGMQLAPGEQVLVGESPEAFAMAVVDLLRDDVLWSRLSGAGRTAVRDFHGKVAAEQALRDILSAVGIVLPPEAFVHRLLCPSDGQHPLLAAHSPAPRLAPMAIVRDAAGFAEVREGGRARRAAEEARALCVAAAAASFPVEGFCTPCGRHVQFTVDAASGGAVVNGVLEPNWRERLECPLCRMNNRQRLMATLLGEALDSRATGQAVYLMEQVTPLYTWALRTFGPGVVVGSEYLGDDCTPGIESGGLRHEDALRLSFGNESVGLIVSSDVFEHVPGVTAAFRECVRVLRPGGTLLFSVPFDAASECSVVRAVRDADGNVQHLLAPVYHGNPLSARGSLVYTDFGRDLLAMLRESGFVDAWAELWLEPSMGHVGPPQIVFRAIKHPSAPIGPTVPDASMAMRDGDPPLSLR